MSSDDFGPMTSGMDSPEGEWTIFLWKFTCSICRWPGNSYYEGRIQRSKTKWKLDQLSTWVRLKWLCKLLRKASFFDILLAVINLQHSLSPSVTSVNHWRHNLVTQKIFCPQSYQCLIVLKKMKFVLFIAIPNIDTDSTRLTQIWVVDVHHQAQGWRTNRFTANLAWHSTRHCCLSQNVTVLIIFILSFSDKALQL